VLQAGKGASTDNRGCAQACQSERDCSAYATSAAGYQGDFAVQSVVHVLFVLNFKKSFSKSAIFSACRNVFVGPVSNLAGYRVLPMDRSKFDFHPTLIIVKGFVGAEGDDY
jgi:hypothetical protein